MIFCRKDKNINTENKNSIYKNADLISMKRYHSNTKNKNTNQNVKDTPNMVKTLSAMFIVDS